MPNQIDKALLTAEYFIKKDSETKKGLSPLKIQKLLYYAQAWNLVTNKKKLFDDDFQAWVHGPAIPRIWQTFREFDFTAEHPEIAEKDFSAFTREERNLLDSVWTVYGKFDGKYLEALTHSEEPWLEARRGMDDADPSQNVISPESMSEYYGKRLSEAEA